MDAKDNRLYREPVAQTAIRKPACKLASVVMRDLKEHRAESRKLRKEAGYVDSTPRCGNCMNIQNPLRDNNGTSTGYVCRLLVARVESTGLCDWWTGIDGSTLDA